MLGDVLALPSVELGIALHVFCNPGLQHTTRSEHAVHRIGSPLAKRGGAEGGLVVLRGHEFCDERHNFKFRSWLASKFGGLRNNVQSLEHLRDHAPSGQGLWTGGAVKSARTNDSTIFRCASGHNG